MSPETDWRAWHDGYADPRSALSRRLHVVQRHIHAWLDATTPSPVSVVSVCAGDGRDLLGVLEQRTDAARVTATLLEAEPVIATRAESHARRLGLDGVEVRCVDAGTTGAYTGSVPADLVLLCGVLGNVDDRDVERTVAALPRLCRGAALVIWTRHRRPPDLTPRIRERFADHGFVEESFTAPPDVLFSIGVHRFEGEPLPLGEDERLFRFVR